MTADHQTFSRLESRRQEQTPQALARLVVIGVFIALWFVLWLGRRQKGTVFLLALPLMFLVGLWAEGQVFTFELSQPLVALAALADLGIGLLYVIVRGLGMGDGRVVAVTYEYGNAFLVVAGLLNMLVVADAYDIALGRK